MLLPTLQHVNKLSVCFSHQYLWKEMSVISISGKNNCERIQGNTWSTLRQNLFMLYAKIRAQISLLISAVWSVFVIHPLDWCYIQNFKNPAGICSSASWFGLIWAATWQNQQNGCASSEDLDQPGHPPSLISLRCPYEKTLGPQLPIECTAKTLWSDWADADSSLGEHSLCWFCHVVAHLVAHLRRQAFS